MYPNKEREWCLSYRTEAATKRVPIRAASLRDAVRQAKQLIEVVGVPVFKVEEGHDQ